MTDEMNEGEAALAALLGQLWLATHEAPDRPCSLARLAKRAGRRMSVLMRELNVLSAAGLVELAPREEGGGSVALGPAGRALCAELFGAARPPGDVRSSG
ncbi:MAG: ArsR family transcriptional regulator [Massilia sp.]